MQKWQIYDSHVDEIRKNDLKIWLRRRFVTTVITNFKFINKVNIFYFLALGMFRKVSFTVLPKAFKYTNIIAFNFFFFFFGMRESCVQCVLQVTVNANIVYTSRYILYIFPDTGFTVSSSHFIFVSQMCFKNLNVFCFLPFALICMHSFSYKNALYLSTVLPG